MLLESSWFLLNYHQEQIKRKRKRCGCGKYFKKEWNQEFAIIYCRRCVPMIENRISGYLYNELFSQSNKEKCTDFESMAWSLICDKNTIKNCSTALQAFSFQSLSFYPLFTLKARILLQFLSQAFSILYMFSPFFFVFIKALITST